MTPSLSRRSLARLATPSVLFAAVCALTLLAYARSFSSPFHFDDYDQILGNQAVQSPTVELLLYWGRARLLPYSTLALNWWLGGNDTTGFHVVNVAIHLLATFFVFRLALALCATPRLRAAPIAENPLFFATAAAVVFACHPIQVQAVTYIVQRVASLCAMFYTGAVYAYVTGRNRTASGRPGARWYMAAVLLGAGALLSKENAFTLPVAIVLVEWFFETAGTLRAGVRRWLPFLLLAFAVPLIWVALWSPHPRLRMMMGPDASWFDTLLRAASPLQAISPLQYFFTQCTVIPRYLLLVLVPCGLTVDHDVPTVGAPTGPVIAGFVFLAALFGFGLYARRRWPVVGFGIVWVFVTLAVESSFFPIGDAMVEHRMYLPMVGLSLAFSSILASAYRSRPASATAIGVAITLALVAMTIARNEVWRTGIGLWRDAVAKSPGKARAHANLATFLKLGGGDLNEAVLNYCEALQIDPAQPNVRRNLEITIDQQLEDLGDDAESDIEMTVSDKGEARVNLDALCRKRLARAPNAP